MIHNHLNNAIVSTNSYVFDFLKDNMPQVSFQLLEGQNQLDDFLRANLVINILILDAVLDFSSAIIRSKNSINLTDIPIKASLKLEKPFEISALIVNIGHYDLDDSIFCRLNDSLLYSQKALRVINTNDGQIVSLTAKESQIIAQLLCARNFTLIKSQIIAEIWPNYSTAQSTLEFHLLNLKNKLDIIEVSDHYVKILF
jgi:hypothetical protein